MSNRQFNEIKFYQSTKFNYFQDIFQVIFENKNLIKKKKIKKVEKNNSKQMFSMCSLLVGLVIIVTGKIIN
jgi:hypothetical protein